MTDLCGKKYSRIDKLPFFEWVEKTQYGEKSYI